MGVRRRPAVEEPLALVGLATRFSRACLAALRLSGRLSHACRGSGSSSPGCASRRGRWRRGPAAPRGRWRWRRSAPGRPVHQEQAGSAKGRSVSCAERGGDVEAGACICSTRGLAEREGSSRIPRHRRRLLGRVGGDGHHLHAGLGEGGACCSSCRDRLADRAVPAAIDHQQRQPCMAAARSPAPRRGTATAGKGAPAASFSVRVMGVLSGCGSCGWTCRARGSLRAGPGRGSKT